MGPEFRIQNSEIRIRTPESYGSLAPALNCDALYPGIIIRAEAHDIGIVFQGVVNDPAIVGIHRFQFHRATRNSNRVGDLANALPKLVIAHGSPVSDVHLDSGRVSIICMKNSIQ
jgi:hypothetical protein